MEAVTIAAPRPHGGKGSVNPPPADFQAVFGYGPIAFIVGVVECVPFMAQVEDIEVNLDANRVRSEERATGSICRDSQGRVRNKFQVRGPKDEGFDLVFVCDYAARTVVAFDVAMKTATRLTDMGPPPGAWPGQGGWAFRGPWCLEGTAEKRTIEGVVCMKAARVAWPLGSPVDPKGIGEIWVSDELKFSVLERVSDPGREHTWRLYDIRRVEPPSSLFVVPAGYTEVVKSKYDAVPPKR